MDSTFSKCSFCIHLDRPHGMRPVFIGSIKDQCDDSLILRGYKVACNAYGELTFIGCSGDIVCPSFKVDTR